MPTGTPYPTVTFEEWKPPTVTFEEWKPPVLVPIPRAPALPSDPNHKRPTGKPKLSLIPLAALIPIARAFEDGIVRAGYARDNWREAADPSYYHDALLRHLSAWQEGEDRASDSGVHHLGHAGACVLILIWHHLCKPREERAAAILPDTETAHVNSPSEQSLSAEHHNK